MIYALLTVAVLVAVLLVFISRQPADFKVVRSAVLPTTPDVLFGHVDNLHKWNEWSPWAKLDPNATNSFSGPESGAGANMSWAGNMQVGIGSMTITDSQPDTRIVLRLDFEKPMKATNIAVFTFEPQDGGTLVTWAMSGQNSFMGKAINLVMNCDKMVGGQFEQGLANLKSVVTA